MKRRARDAVFRLDETVSDKTVVPVVCVADLNLVLAFADGGRNINLPRSTPCNAAIDAVDEHMGEACGNATEGEGKSVGVWECGSEGVWE